MKENIDTALLRKNIVKHFNEGELRTLCFDLGVDYEELPGSGKSNKVRELIEYQQRREQLDSLIYECAKLRPTVDWQITHSENLAICPFKGLDYFKKDDAGIFFGREDLINRLVKHVYNNSFLAIVGASGSGKSSVVHAGLIPAIERGHQVDNTLRPKDSEFWTVCVTTPKDHPLDALATALTPKHESINYTTDLRKALESNPLSLRLQVRKILNESESEHLLLVIDQFEELFKCSESERQKFLDCIFASVDLEVYGATIVIIVLRADFYNRCLSYDPLRALLEQKQIIVGKMSNDDLRQTIEKPAAYYSVKIEQGLTEEMLHDIGNEPGALPLLSYALLETWKRRDKERNMLTIAGYIQAGRVQGAIANSANEVFNNQLSEGQKKTTRNIFLSLMESSEEAPPTRKRADLNDLISHTDNEKDARQILYMLVGKRLLTVSSERNEVFVEISHEALLHEWRILDDWLAEFHDQLRLRRILNRDALEWQATGKNPSYLYTDDKLNKVSGVFYKTNYPNEQESEAHAVSLNELENLFLEESIRVYNEKKAAELRAYNEKKAAELRAYNEKKAAIRRQRIQLILFVFILFLVVGLFQIKWVEGRWKKLPEIDGGNVTAIAINPQTTSEFYLAVDGKDESVIYKSNDGGNSWIRLDKGLHKIRVNDILINPNKPEIIYLGTEGGGVFKSTDSGDTWSPNNIGLRSFSVRKMILDPNENILYLATYGRDGGVYKSENDGLSWQSVSQGLPSSNITDISINSDKVLFAATEDDGIYLSDDRGANWESTALTTINVRQVVADPLNPQVIYAGTRSRGVFKSSDSGITWQPINSGLPVEKEITAVEVSTDQPQTIYITLQTKGGNRFFISHDQGNSWIPEPHPAAGAYVNYLLNGDVPNKLYLATEAGLFSFDEIQKDSQRISVPYYQVNASDIALNANNSTIFVSVLGGVFRSHDKGETWLFSNAGLTSPTIRVITPDPLNESRLYVGTYSDRTPEVIFFSDDQGETWNPLTTAENVLPDDDVRAIVVDPHDTKTLYVSTFGSGIFKSSNQGEAWEPINSGITRLEIIELKMDPYNNNILYAIAAGGPIFRTADSGETWQSIPETTNKDIRDIMIDDSRICIVVYGQNQGNFQCSEDLGLGWYGSDSELESRFVNQLEKSKTHLDYLYAGTTDQGVFLSKDNGRNWSVINNELSNGSIISLLAENHAEIMYSVVASDGAYSYQEQFIWDK